MDAHEFGHTVRRMTLQFVKPYVKTNKNDMADAEAICEAVSRPNMQFMAGRNDGTATAKELQVSTCSNVERNVDRFLSSS
jgi:transposase